VCAPAYPHTNTKTETASEVGSVSDLVVLATILGLHHLLLGRPEGRSSER
jgi:hypothetical protein